MNCKEARELLTGIPEEFNDGEKAGLLEHLKGCARCREEQELLAKSWELLDAYEAPQLGPEFSASVLRRAKAARAEAAGPALSLRLAGLLRLPRAALAFAALAIALALPPLWKAHREKPVPAFSRTAEITVAAPKLPDDKEIVENLDLYEDADLLENSGLLADLDTVESGAAADL